MARKSLWHVSQPLLHRRISPAPASLLTCADKPRTLALEYSFFDAFNLYFRMTPVVGGDSEVRVYLCQRWRITTEWQIPKVEQVMNGAPGVLRGRDFGYIDQMFASMEW